MKYLPPVNPSVATPLHTLMSSRPPTILPLPSAVKVPARVKKLLLPAQSSVPLMENAYWPTKLAFENFGGGGGVVPLPRDTPHPAATIATTTKTANATRLPRMLIEHVHWRSPPPQLQGTPLRGRAPEDIPGAIRWQWTAALAVPIG